MQSEFRKDASPGESIRAGKPDHRRASLVRPQADISTLPNHFFLGDLFGAAVILSINRTCQKSEFNRILLEKRTQRNPALYEFAFLVSVVYARKHCILKEVGYHLNIDLFF